MTANIEINNDSITMLTPSKLRFLFKNYNMNSPELTSQCQLKVEKLIRQSGSTGINANMIERLLGFSLARNLHQYLALLITKGYIFRRVNPKRKNAYIYYSICHLRQEEKTVNLKSAVDWTLVIS